MNIHKHSIMYIIVTTLLLTACSAPAVQAGPTSTTVETEAAIISKVITPATTDIQITRPPQTSAPAISSTDESSVPLINIPLKDALGSLEPQDVFQNFYDITQVPRPSGQMDQIREFLVNFGNELGLETIVDDSGNVIIRKPAAKGMEKRQGVVLQAHMDMVPQKEDGKEFNFTTDPIEAFVSGDTIVTEGTTLGADNGIGIAMIMAVLQSDNLQAGPLEALFTVDEETSMSGVNGLKPDALQGRILINLDSEEEGVFTIGAAGGEHAAIHAAYPQVPAPREKAAYQVKVQGLKGGHSGVDINLGRGHATKILVRLLKEAAVPYGLRLASLSGGTVSNAIPRDATALVFIADAQVDSFLSFAREFEATVQNELKAVEPDLSIEVTTVQAPLKVMDETFQKTLINALYGTPQGVLRMSDSVPGLVETSTNTGVTNAQDGKLVVDCTVRSSVDSELEDTGQMIASVWELAGFSVEFSGFYSGWPPDPESPILMKMKDAYKELYGNEAGIMAVHAGLECGTIGGKYPDMDMISIGPTMNNVHSPSERLYIPSVEKVMRLLFEVLQSIPEE